MNMKSSIIAALILCSAFNIQAVEPELMALSALKQTVHDELVIPLIGIAAVVIVAHIGVKLFRMYSLNAKVPALKKTTPYRVQKIEFKRTAPASPFKAPTLDKKQTAAPVATPKAAAKPAEEVAAKPALVAPAKVEPELTINDRLYEYLTTTC